MEIGELNNRIKDAILYLNDQNKTDKYKLPSSHRIALESRVNTLTDVALLICGNKSIDLTNLFWD